MLQYFELPDVKAMIDGLEYTSEGLYDLVAILDKPYDKEKLEKILAANIFSKLVWNQKHDIMNVKTNYAYLQKMIVEEV